MDLPDHVSVWRDGQAGCGADPSALFALSGVVSRAVLGRCLWLCGDPRLGVGGALALAPFVWVAVELARARITGFPWDLLGNSLVDNLFVTKIAPFAGVMGISLLIAAVNAAIACFWVVGKTWRWGLGGAGVVVALGLEAACLMKAPASLKIGTQQIAVMVQENIAVGGDGAGDEAAQCWGGVTGVCGFESAPVGFRQGWLWVGTADSHSLAGGSFGVAVE